MEQSYHVFRTSSSHYQTSLHFPLGTLVVNKPTPNITYLQQSIINRKPIKNIVKAAYLSYQKSTCAPNYQTQRIPLIHLSRLLGTKQHPKHRKNIIKSIKLLSMSVDQKHELTNYSKNISHHDPPPSPKTNSSNQLPQPLSKQ